MLQCINYTTITWVIQQIFCQHGNFGQESEKSARNFGNPQRRPPTAASDILSAWDSSNTAAGAAGHSIPARPVSHQKHRRGPQQQKHQQRQRTDEIIGAGKCQIEREQQPRCAAEKGQHRCPAHRPAQPSAAHHRGADRAKGLPAAAAPGAFPGPAPASLRATRVVRSGYSHFDAFMELTLQKGPG